MIYYPRYPAHYVAKTLHLTMEQDGAYTRLLDWCYMNERPIPKQKRFVIARASKPSEKRAVDLVLSEFFSESENGWENVRVVDEIRQNSSRRERSKANGRKGGRPPKHPEPENPLGFPEKPSGFSVGSENANLKRTRKKTSQQPTTNNQQDTDSLARSTDGGGVSRAVSVCLQLRERGCTAANPQHPDLLAAMAEGVAPLTVVATYDEGVAAGKGNPWAWALTTARNRHARGASPTTGAGPPPHRHHPALTEVPADAVYTGTPNDELPPELRRRV